MTSPVLEKYVKDPCWYKALSLRERMTLCRSAAIYKLETDWAMSARRIRSLKSYRPFSDDSYLARRAAAEHLTPEEFSRWLGVNIGSVCQSISAPEWLEEIGRAYCAEDASEALPAGLDTEPPASKRGLEFLSIVEPLVRRGVDRLCDEARSICESHADPPFDADATPKMLCANLHQPLLARLTRTMILEMNVSRLRGELCGSGPGERYRSFFHRVRKPDLALKLLGEYPVLARRLLTCIDDWLDCSLEFLRRLCADIHHIRATFSAEGELGKLVEVRAGAGDTHRRGRTVMIVRFDSGQPLVYKPRSMAVDVHFGQLLSWLNERGSYPPFRTLKILDRKTHGWSEFIPAGGCTSAEQVSRFYERQGGYLALLHALEATDFHFENLIASGEHPVLVDLEALFHPRIGGSDPGALILELESHALEHSVLRVGLLPQRVWTNADHDGLELSGLGGMPGQLTPHRVLTYEREGTDEMRVVRKQIRMSGANNRPTLNGAGVRVQDYIESLIAGYNRVYDLLIAHREELLSLDGPLARFSEDEVRAVIRPTRTYGLLLTESHHPDVLRDALELDLLLDRLWLGVERSPHLLRLIPHEKAELARGDVPLFTTRPASCDLWTSAGERLPDFFREPSLSLAFQRLHALTEKDRSQQLWFIRASLTTLEMGRAHETPKSCRPSDSNLVLDRQDPELLLASARAVADRLGQMALRSNDQASWIGVSLVKERIWSLLPSGVDLYNGTLGIVMFLAYTGALTNEQRYMTLARDAANATRLHLAEILSQRKLTGNVGAFSGLGGVIYVWSHLGMLWGERTYISEAEDLAQRLSGLIAEDGDLDVISGAAGCLLSLLSLYHCSSSAGTLSAAVKCGEILIERSQPMECGTAWRTLKGEAKRPLTGFSHGAAGIALALLELAAITGEERYRTVALDAIAYERSVFSSTMENWPDFREFGGSADASAGAAQSRSMVAWCHGAPGIGLARIRSMALVDEPGLSNEIAAALKTTTRNGFGFNHSLCHGDLGNVELLLQASRLFGEPRLRADLDRTVASIHESILSGGWICGIPLGAETPGLMTGLAGIGYGLLRLARPERVPSLLLLEPPSGGRNFKQRDLPQSCQPAITRQGRDHR